MSRLRSSVKPNLFLRLSWVVLIGLPGNLYAQSTSPIGEAVARQMIETWSDALVDNDIEGLALYYADPRGVTPWRERLAAARVSTANLLAIHSIRSVTDANWRQALINGEVRFTIEFWLEGHGFPLNETRNWGITNRNGYLQIAYEKKEAAPLVPPRRVEQAQFPPLAGQPGQEVQLIEPFVQPTPIVASRPQSQPTPRPAATPTLNESPISKQELINEIWNELLLRFKKSYEYRSEDMFVSCFVKRPSAALGEFRENIGGRGWMQVTRLEIDADSVKGNNLNSTFKFRYSLWGSGMERDKIVEVDCAAIKGGPGWRFARFGGELLSQPSRAPGYYPTNRMIQPLVTGPGQSMWGRLFGGGANTFPAPNP